MMNSRCVGATAALAACCVVPAGAWHDAGHTYAARAALTMLPEDVPAFFREGAAVIQHCALDPDLHKHEQAPQLSNAHGPEHFLDAELLQGRDWPATRHAYYRLCEELDIEPDKAGTLPYAIAEHTQMLMLAFAELRRDPDNPAIHARCLVVAGHLSHYTADLHMPLHTTLHFDGLVSETPGQPKRAKGIHGRVDALPTKLAYHEQFPPDDPRKTIEPVDPATLMSFIKSHFDSSHSLVMKTYGLEPGIPAMTEMTIRDPAVRDFTIERMNASAEFTASIFLTAWRGSADIRLPGWLDRSFFDHGFDPAVVAPQSGM